MPPNFGSGMFKYTRHQPRMDRFLNTMNTVCPTHQEPARCTSKQMAYQKPLVHEQGELKSIKILGSILSTITILSYIYYVYEKVYNQKKGGREERANSNAMRSIPKLIVNWLKN
jgi:hypothetical protein